MQTNMHHCYQLKRKIFFHLSLIMWLYVTMLCHDKFAVFGTTFHFQNEWQASKMNSHTVHIQVFKAKRHERNKHLEQSSRQFILLCINLSAHKQLLWLPQWHVSKHDTGNVVVEASYNMFDHSLSSTCSCWGWLWIMLELWEFQLWVNGCGWMAECILNKDHSHSHPQAIQSNQSS